MCLYQASGKTLVGLLFDFQRSGRLFKKENNHMKPSAAEMEGPCGLSDLDSGAD